MFLGGWSRVPAPRTLDKCSPLIGGAGTRDEPLRMSGRFKSKIATKHFASERMFVGLKDVRKLKFL